MVEPQINRLVMQLEQLQEKLDLEIQLEHIT